ncbi:MAG: hypothetical protein H0W64_08820 [Gammaproteobacteria bacterium]|nr:hypothetical protein [Gammaproteobacteria bacterium]
MQKLSTRNGKHKSHYDLEKDFRHIKDALLDTSGDIKGRASEILARSLRDMRLRSEDARDTVTDYIIDQPFKSLGFAALGGFILGLLIRRK